MKNLYECVRCGKAAPIGALLCIACSIEVNEEMEDRSDT